MAKRSIALLSSLLALTAASCQTAADGIDGDTACAGKCDDPTADQDRGVCVGVRGNGQLIFAHFASLARIVEHYGLVTGAAGGSSASITIFLTESIHANAALYDCAGYTCDADETAARAALLYKSLQGYVDVLGGTEEAVAFQALTPVAKRVQDEGVAALLETDAEAARLALLDILGSEDLRDLINDEVLELLTQSPDPAFHTREIVEALQGFANFSVDNDRILIRPGVIDFPALAEKLGRIANFYAGYGPIDPVAMDQLLSNCATPGRGLNWAEVAALPAGKSTCGALFADILTGYRERLLADESAVASRIDDPVGMVLPALVSTSILAGDAVTEFAEARANYLAAQEYEFEVDFADVRFGYWGPQGVLDLVERNPNGYYDAKTAKFLGLGETTWREALAYSPAEPGLARALELGDDLVSAGGWSDLHPTLVLQNMGCENVVYVTRRGDESSFAQGVAGLLGMTDEHSRELYDLDSDSAYALSIEEADAVWCTDWNSFPGTEIQKVSDDGYNAPLESSDPYFTEGDDAYTGATDSIGARGCTPGA